MSEVTQAENAILRRVAEILCGHFSPHPWGAVADDKRELRQLLGQGSRDINEPTKADLLAAAFDVLVWLRDNPQAAELSAAKAAIEAAAKLADARYTYCTTHGLAITAALGVFCALGDAIHALDPEAILGERKPG